MAKRIKRDYLLDVISPDTVAECYGVSPLLYAKIWNEIVPMYKAEMPDEERTSRETPNTVKAFWKYFSDDEKHELNNAVKDDE